MQRLEERNCASEDTCADAAEGRKCRRFKLGEDGKRWRKRGEEESGGPGGSLKAQCVRENRSVPSPRQPTAQAH